MGTWVTILSVPLFVAASIQSLNAAPVDSLRLPGMAPERSAYDVPIDPDLFLIRPGESLIVTFLQSSLAALDLTVGQDGRLVHSSLGVFDLAGKTLSETRTLLAEPLRKAFRAAEIDIAVGPPRRVGIAVQGAVLNPGVYQLYTSQRVSEAIAAAGGIRPDGTRRLIRLVSGNRTVMADLDKAQNLGDMSSDPFLYAGRRVIVDNRSESVVMVGGEVMSPSVFELLPGDSLGLLLALAGGLTPVAEPSRTLVVCDSARSISVNSRLKPGDHLCVPARTSPELSMVSVTGAVGRPGRFNLDVATDLAALIQRCGGFDSTANSRRTALFRRPSVSCDRFGSSRSAVAIRLPNESKLFSGIALMPGDSVVIPVRTGVVEVRGPVAFPGSFATISNGTVADYLAAAGGVQSGGKPYRIRVMHPAAKLGTMATTTTLVEDGDEIHVELESEETR